jgi:hypothetical protein
MPRILLIFIKIQPAWSDLVKFFERIFIITLHFLLTTGQILESSKPFRYAKLKKSDCQFCETMLTLNSPL